MRASSSSTPRSTATRPKFRREAVLVVGAGNSGAEIAIELAPHHQTWLSGPDTGAGTRPRRKSSRSPGHAHHVVRGDAVDGKDGAWTEAPRPLYRPPSWNPSGAGATKGFCPRRHRTSAANDRREERISRPRGWKGPRGVERHLVHRIRTRLRLDRSLAAEPTTAFPFTIGASSSPVQVSTSSGSSSSTR